MLQGSGEPTSAFLPNCVSGYAFVFPASSSTGRKPQELLSAKQRPTWSLSYDASDPLAHVVAERIQLNARDAGISLRLINSGTADVRLVRVPLLSSSPQVALAELARKFELAQPRYESSSITELYSAENTLLKSHRIIPLFYLRTAFAVRPSVHNWNVLPDGDLQLSSVWLSAEKP